MGGCFARRWASTIGGVVSVPGTGAGRVVAGRYELVVLLGRGGMGQVWAARDLTLRREVAVKVLPEPEDPDDTAAAELAAARFAREATAAAFNHPNVVTVHDFGVEPGGRPYLVMERLHGHDLAAVLRTRLPTLAEVVEWTSRVCAALEAAHADGMVHRTSSPRICS
ncbi:serine/threonine protein kinase [Embleya sp. AB8]